LPGARITDHPIHADREQPCAAAQASKHGKFVRRRAAQAAMESGAALAHARKPDINYLLPGRQARPRKELDRHPAQRKPRKPSRA
jgi:hypothetical protein